MTQDMALTTQGGLAASATQQEEQVTEEAIVQEVASMIMQGVGTEELMNQGIPAEIIVEAVAFMLVSGSNPEDLVNQGVSPEIIMQTIELIEAGVAMEEEPQDMATPTGLAGMQGV